MVGKATIMKNCRGFHECQKDGLSIDFRSIMNGEENQGLDKQMGNQNDQFNVDGYEFKEYGVEEFLKKT